MVLNTKVVHVKIYETFIAYIIPRIVTFLKIFHFRELLVGNFFQQRQMILLTKSRKIASIPCRAQFIRRKSIMLFGCDRKLVNRMAWHSHRERPTRNSVPFTAFSRTKSAPYLWFKCMNNKSMGAS